MQPPCSVEEFSRRVVRPHLHMGLEDTCTRLDGLLPATRNARSGKRVEVCRQSGVWPVKTEAQLLSHCALPGLCG